MITANRQVQIIPAIPRAVRLNRSETKKPIICAYARVSTKAEEQEDSYERQIDHYTRLIKSREDWEFGGMYADQGITGTKSEIRPEFMKMLEAARSGKIDRIYCKNVSRFARNTVDALKFIRELREKGVGITFEGEGVDTLTPGGDMLIAILAAQAEQESRNISKNVTWGFREKFRKGEIMLNCSRFLGYKRSDNGQLEIIEEEAKIVRRIYREFLNGYSTKQIAEGLTRDGVPTLSFKNPSEKMKAKGLEYKGWYPCTIRSILQNEKYKGSCLSLKTIKPELTGKRIKNDNQEQQFYIENSHPAIISKNTFELAQAEYSKRQNLRSCGETGDGRYTSKYPLSGILVCGSCGNRYRRWAHYYKGEAIRMWTCLLHQKHADECEADAVREQAVIDGYMSALRGLVGQADSLSQILGESIEEALLERQEADLAACDADIISIQEEMLKLYKEKNKLGQGIYQAKENEVANRIEELNSQRLGLECKLQKTKLAKYRAEEMLGTIAEMTALTEFDETIFRTLTEKITALQKNKIRIYFKCGIEIETEI